MLAENGRLQKLNSIINSFKVIMAAHRGDLPCIVTTAKVHTKLFLVLNVLINRDIHTSINIKYA